MKVLTLLRQILVFTVVVLVSACASVGGDVVQVHQSQKGLHQGLDDEHLVKLESIRKAKPEEEIDDSLRTVIKETRHFSGEEYLREYPRLKGSQGSDFKVGGYDVLNIVVYEEEDLSRESVRVSADGYISFPLIGRIKLDGLTTSQIEERIALKLADGQYLLDAHVSVMVMEYNSKRFLVLGAVREPGSYSLEAEERVLDGVSRAGGIIRGRDASMNQAGAGKRAMIIRTKFPNTSQEEKIVINIDLQSLLNGSDQTSNLFLSDKDVLFIPTAELFYIIGEVKNPGAYSIPDKEMTLVEAISVAGGFTPIAARNKTRIIRVEEGVEKIIVVQVDAITNAGKKIQDINIQADDVIVVPESFF